MTEWKDCKLGDLLTLEYGKSLKGYHDTQSGFPVYGTNGQIGYTQNALCPDPGIVIGRKGAYRGVHFSSTPFFVIDTAFYVKLKAKEVDLDFLYNFLLGLDINSMDSGSAIPSTDRFEIYEIDILLPPFPEQRAIAGVLSSLDDKIDLLHRQNKTLEAMAEALFRQWFVEEVGAGWEEGVLGNYVSTVDNRGKTPPNSEEYTSFPVIEVNALGKDNRLVDYSVIKKYVDEDTHKNWYRNRLKKHDTLIATVGSIGAISMYVVEVGNIAQNIIGLHAETISTFFLYQFVKHKIDEMIQMDIGGVQPSIKVPHLLSIPIIVPPKEYQNRFDEQMYNIVLKMERNIFQIYTLKKLRNTLLPKLMSGEVRVAI
jgi:type I restriction enzyme, S subunit